MINEIKSNRLIFLTLLFVLNTWAATSSTRLQPLINPPRSVSDNQIWLGGDVASSIKWNNDRYIWLFGDTLLGKSRFPVRIPISFIHNSVGIMRYSRSEQRWQAIRKYHREKANRPRAIFELADSRFYFWPLTGIRISNKLLILGTYSKAKQGLNVQGSAWVLVDNPQEEPTQWRYHIKKLAGTNTTLTWSSAVVVGDKQRWLYIFGDYRKNKRSKSMTVLARITIADALHGYWQNRQYWTSIGWQSSTYELNGIVGLPAASERSLFYSNKWGWYTAQIPSLTARVIYLYTSARLTGPWHIRSKTSLRLPWSSDVNHKYFFYAAKLHPQFKENKFIATYNINTFDDSLFKKQFPTPSHCALYLPQFITLAPPRKTKQSGFCLIHEDAVERS